MNNPPLVSICIPTFNGEEFLQQALDSVLQQSYKNIELIISDDSSVDQTLLIVTDFKEKAPFPIKIFSHNPQGIGANWNNCIKNATGEYIKFLFQDDILFPTCVEDLVREFTKNKNVGLVSCKRSLLVEGEATEEIETWKRKYGNLQEGLKLGRNGCFLIDSTILKKEKFISNNKIGEPSTVLFSRAVVEKVGYFREDLNQVLDFEFYYRILKHSKIIIFNKELAGFRIHPAQATNMNKNNISTDYENYYKILYKEFFWYLGYNTQKKLLKRYHPLGKLYNYLRF